MKRTYFISVFISVVISVNQLLSGEWTLTGSLNQSRHGHCAVTLNDGRVLIAGGSGRHSVILSSCEIYDPETGEWTETDSMQAPQINFTMVKLKNGNILAIGGSGGSNSSEIYDPTTETWTLTDSMPSSRSYSDAVLLPSGSVLIAGGLGNYDRVISQLYNPTTDEWTITGSLNEGRMGHTLTLLPNGNVLSVGDDNSDICEIYNPETEEWAITGNLNQQRLYHQTQTLLLENIGTFRVLTIAGLGFGDNFLNSCEIYDPKTEQWTYTDSLEVGRCNHVSSLLPNGNILTNGGYNPTLDRARDWYLKNTDTYLITTQLWQQNSDMHFGRMNHASAVLLDGRVITIGGVAWYDEYNGSTEIYSWNHQPEITQIQGPEHGFIGDTLCFSITASDPDNDSISVRFSCNGDTSGWSELLPSGSIFEKNYCWESAGEYQIQIQIRDLWQPQGIHNSLSEWISGPTVIITPVVGIEPEPEKNSLRFNLSQNYPNPFNISTTIVVYNLEKDGEFELAIYNLNGQKMEILESGKKKKDRYQVKWTPKNLASGIYFCRLTTPYNSFFKKLMLLK